MLKPTKTCSRGNLIQWGRSHGFFVYVFGRLINVADGHFGIKTDELRHGTFGRIRVVVNMNGLDAFLQSDREHIREGPVLADAQNILRGIFNFVKSFIDKHDAGEDPGTKLARKLGGSPASLSRRPIIELARASLHGKIRSRYLAIPPATTPKESARTLFSASNNVLKPLSISLRGLISSTTRRWMTELRCMTLLADGSESTACTRS